MESLAEAPKQAAALASRLANDRPSDKELAALEGVTVKAIRMRRYRGRLSLTAEQRARYDAAARSHNRPRVALRVISLSFKPDGERPLGNLI